MSNSASSNSAKNDAASRNERLDAIAPPHIRAQAAVWVTDLHGPDRNAKLEARVRRWIAEDSRHAAAFELATEAWQRSGNLLADLPARETRFESALPNAKRSNRSLRIGPLSIPVLPTRAALAGIVALCAALTVTFYLLKDETLATGPAEQRTVELTDGTQVSLNANSRILVRYDQGTRQVTLAKGEALFNVAKHQSRPFVVLIGAHKVIALGTAFEVRIEDSQAAAYTVTLVEGRVAIEPRGWPNALPDAPAPGLTLLDPGQRLQVTAGAPDRVDHPSVERVTAWQKGQLIFEDASLREAAHEFNRYGTRKITIAATVPESLRVGGVFRIGDPASFAQAMANAYQLRVIDRGQEIFLEQR